MKIHNEKKKEEKASITFYTSPERKKILKKIAQEKNITVSYLLNAILEEVFKDDIKNK